MVEVGHFWKDELFFINVDLLVLGTYHFPRLDDINIGEENWEGGVNTRGHMFPGSVSTVSSFKAVTGSKR